MNSANSNQAAADELQARVLLVSLRMTGWRGNVRDAAATQELLESSDAEEGMARVHKSLLKRGVMKPVNAASIAIRRYHARKTLPWNDQGQRVMPVASHAAYVAHMESLFDKRRAAVQDMLGGYEEAVREAQAMLGSLYDPDDYPDRDSLERRFQAEYQFDPLPRGKHLEALMEHADFVELKASIERNAEKRINHAITDIYRRLHDAAKNLADHIRPEAGKTLRVHASIFNHLKEVAEAVGELNITEDPELTKWATDIKAALRDVDVKELRPTSKTYSEEKSETLRQKLDTFSTRLAGYGGHSDA